MAGHIPILGPGGTSSVPVGTAATEPGARVVVDAAPAPSARPTHAWKEPTDGYSHRDRRPERGGLRPW